MTTPHEPLEAVMMSAVRLSPARICDGFTQQAFLTVFARAEPALCLCVRRHGKHMHLFVEARDQAAVRVLTDAAMLSADGVAEGVLLDVFDPANEAERRAMEVNSRQRSN